jgi:hypothetical protein
MGVWFQHNRWIARRNDQYLGCFQTEAEARAAVQAEAEARVAHRTAKEAQQPAAPHKLKGYGPVTTKTKWANVHLFNVPFDQR